LRLPIGVDDALAESRGYRVSFVLAHQHLAQLTNEVGHAIDANVRNKIYLTVSPDDARHDTPSTGCVSGKGVRGRKRGA
jgi:hypothetical protein